MRHLSLPNGRSAKNPLENQTRRIGKVQILGKWKANMSHHHTVGCGAVGSGCDRVIIQGGKGTRPKRKENVE
jgi:hypothetical protein